MLMRVIGVGGFKWDRETANPWMCNLKERVRFISKLAPPGGLPWDMCAHPLPCSHQQQIAGNGIEFEHLVLLCFDTKAARGKRKTADQKVGVDSEPSLVLWAHVTHAGGRSLTGQPSRWPAGPALRAPAGGLVLAPPSQERSTFPETRISYSASVICIGYNKT